MLRFGKRVDRTADRTGEAIDPERLAAPMDARRFQQKFSHLLEQLSGIGGIDPLVEALETKAALFARVLAPENIDTLDREGIELLLDTIMPARRRMGSVLVEIGGRGLGDAIKRLIYGKAPLAERFNAFADQLSAQVAVADQRAERKLHRALSDFGAELLHFRAPETYPLMTRWVWDPETSSGAMRELLAGGDTATQIPWSASPGTYEAGRIWAAERMVEAGVYRESHFPVDIFFAHAYADYMRSMSAGMGMLKADFGESADPMDIVKKLLGIDKPRRKGLRMKHATKH